MAAAAVPIIASAVGSYIGRKDAQGAATPTGPEQNALTGQANSANLLYGQAQRTSRMALPAAQQATGYFSKLAQGSRGDLTQALAPDIQDTNAAYTGAGKSISRFLRGPDRSVQLGEMDRERSGRVAGLFSTARQNANTQLANISSGLLSQSNQGASGAGGLFGSSAQQQGYNRLTGEQIQSQAGEDWGNLFFQLTKSMSQRPGSGSGLPPPQPGAF